MNAYAVKGGGRMFYARLKLYDPLAGVATGHHRYTIFKDQESLQAWYEDHVHDLALVGVGECSFNSRGILQYDEDHEQHLHD